MKTDFSGRARVWALVGFGLLAGAAFAQPAGGPPPGKGGAEGGGRPHGPPPEAVGACKGLASGAACNFVGRDNEKLAGTCSGPPPRGEHPPGPPPVSGKSDKADKPAMGKKPAKVGEAEKPEGGAPPLACRPDRNVPPGNDAPKR